MTEGVGRTAIHSRLRGWTAGLLFVAAFVNLIAVSEYSNAWFGFSAAYLLIAASQAFMAFLLLFAPWQYDPTGERRGDLEREGWPYYVAGSLLCLTPVLLYIAIHTLGLGQFGRPGGSIDPTPMSVAARLIEIVLISCLVTLIWRTRDGQRKR
jgi:uncharacterized membrane protein